jgi:hypothetical protein
MLKRIEELERVRVEAQAKGVPCTVKDLRVTGYDAQAAGLRGEDIGCALAQILDEVAVDPSELRRSRDWQLRRLKWIAALQA